MTYKLPHDKDFATNGDLPRYLNENAQAIEQAIDEIYQRIGKLEEKEKSDIEQLKGSITKLDQEKATHDDVTAMRTDLQNRINHLYAGDPRTIKAVVTKILKEEGVI